jgi:DnaJ-class molecular chaperone
LQDFKNEAMKRVNEYKKIFNVEEPLDLKQLKTTYRNLVKEWHPDKFSEGDERAEKAREKSTKIIDAYHFLVSIAPETHAANLEEYTKTATESGIGDYHYKNQVLEITFLDGNTYEYFGVTKNIYNKFLNADNAYRFARRNILNSHLYRKSKKTLENA